MGWSPHEYYTSSPEEFYYACQGFFNKEEDRMIIQRKVARSSFWGTQDEFDTFWPLPEKFKQPEVKIDFTSDEYKRWFEDMKNKTKVKQ